MSLFKDCNRIEGPCHRAYEPYCTVCAHNKHSVGVKAIDTQVGGGHYKAMAIQPITFIIDNKISYLEGNVIKYICRHKSKNGKEDIKKAIQYCNFILENYDKI